LDGQFATAPVRRLTAVIGYLFLLRLIFAACIDLMPEEAYYWNYSRHLDFGYLDHPPLTAWLIRLGTTVFGNTAFGVRFGALCCGIIASIFAFRLARNLFGEAVALVAVLLAQVLPFFFFSGLLTTPDAPLTAAWAAALYFLERALIADRPRAWLWVGVSMGLGLLSKYTIGLLGLAAFGFMVIDRPSRRWFGRWEPYAAVLIAAALFAPVVVWNAQHDWASFSFQTSRRLAELPRFSVHKLLGGAIVLITPTGVFAVAAAFFAGSADRTRSWRLLQLSLLVPLAVFFLFSLRHEVKLDWTGAPWVAALPVMAWWGMAGTRAAGTRADVAAWARLRGAWLSTVGILLAIYGVGLYYLVIGLPGVGYPRQTELVPLEWRDFGRQIDVVADALRAKLGDGFLVVGMDRYAIASELAFYSRDQATSVADTSAGHLLGGMGVMYEQWFPAERQNGKTLLLVAWDPNSLAEAGLEKHFAGLEAVHEGTLVRNGRVVRHYYYRVGNGYRFLP
jgi:dolichol-phosphate mannosyltransferase